MADLTEVYAALQKADAAGDTAGAKQLADYIRSQSSSTPRTAEAPADPAGVYTNTLQVFNPFGQNFNTHIPIGQGTQNFLAGAGKATYDLGRGAGQMLGLVSRQDVAEARARDAPLMATGAGRAGMLTGTVADLLPAAFIPGANTLAGAGAIGAGMGLLQPSAGTAETALNVGLGGLSGPGSILAGRGAGALYQGAKAAVEPLFRGGQERVAARALQAFAGGQAPAAQAAATLGNAPAVLPGVQSTTAELAGNAGLSQLERTLRNNPEYLQAFTERNQANRAAMTAALGDIAGTDTQMATAQAARLGRSAPLYSAAQHVVVPADADLGALLARPSMTAAWNRARQLAAESGESLIEPNANEISGKTLQYLKMGLNDIVNTGPQSGMGAHEVGAVRSTLGSLSNWITTNVPELRAADQTYAALSKPINQMEIGTALSNRLQPALADFGGNTRLSANSYAAALRNSDQLAAGATGWRGAKLPDILNLDQLKTLTQVGEQLARRANADELGRAVGSNTGQNLISQNVLRQILGPMGLPQSMSERAAQSAFGQSVLRPVQWLSGTGEPRVMAKLAEAALNPAVAKGLLEKQSSQAIARALWKRQGLPGVVGQSVAYSAQQ